MPVNFKLKANPTFRAPVAIPIAGSDKPETVVMVFRHRTKSELKEFYTYREGREDHEVFMEMVVGWELEEPFNVDNVKELLENYGGAGVATYLAYIEELTKARAKN